MYENKQAVLSTIEEDITLNMENYKDILEMLNEIILVIELDEKFIPNCFVEHNSKIFNKLGYSENEFFKIKPSNIFNLNKDEVVLDFYRNLINKKYDKVEATIKTKDEKIINVEAKMFFIERDQKNFVFILASDITKYSRLVDELNGILNGIPDVIKVFSLDKKIICMNDAGYSFYSTTPQEAIGRSCSEFRINGQECMDCCFEKVIQTKEMINNEKYIPELNKFMDVCYNPVFGEDGEVLFVVERLRDITEKKIIDKVLKESKERYKQIINNFPDPTVIVVDNKIVLANNKASDLIGIDSSELVGSNVYKHFHEKYVKSLHKRFRSVISQKKEKETYDIEYCFPDGRVAYLEISFSYVLYEGSPGTLIVIRDITEIKHELNKAAQFQRNTLQKSFPAEEFVTIESVYLPANIVSGDFYRICKINEDFIIGIVVDVRGKGMSAALNISAFDILFLQEVAITNEPINIVRNLNKKLVSYYEENYIAVCCFGMDFNKGELNVVGAGINQFILQQKGKAVEEKIVEGPFLGMFEESEFSEKIFKIETGDKIFFFTDGLEFILDEDQIIQKYMEKASICEFKEFIEIFSYNNILENGTLKDDCTMIAMEIK